MADHIPFVTSVDGAKLVSAHYLDSEIVRVPLDRASILLERLPHGLGIWLDAGADGLDNLESRRPRGEQENPWFTFMSDLSNFENIGTPAYQQRPVRSEVSAFVTELLDACVEYHPAWITVPQVPLASDSARNKINRMLAEESGIWKNRSGFPGRLILPLVVTHQRQINGKTVRNPKVEQADAATTWRVQTGIGWLMLNYLMTAVHRR